MSKPDRTPDAPAPVVTEKTPTTFALQRKCACGGGASALTGECDDCEKKKLQRSAAGSAPHDVPESVGDVMATAGTPLDPGARQDMESRFGHDFGSVRIHTDARAAESARSVGALAYTVGSHVVFGAAQYAPSTRAGRHLLAHELTHTIQQRSGFKLQRQEAVVSSPTDAAEIEADHTADTVASTYLVEDDAQPGSGQMRKTEFLDELQRSSCIAADAELARVGRSTEGCPFVERAFSRYRTMPAARVEQAIRRYIDPAGVTGASDYIPLVTRRVAEGVARWAETGDMSGVPPELAADAMGGGGGVMGMLGGMLGGGLAGLVGGIGRLLFKREGGAATPAEAAMVSSRLGGGAPLESGVRGRMENALGHDFSRVRVHSGSTAAGMSSSLGARAFTLGGDIGFAAGEYQPNTPVGDALIAHELAHVVQQSGGASGSATSEVEEDADFSAVGAVMSVWGGVKQIARSAMPRMRAGLRLQRCSSPGEFPKQGILIRAADLQAAVPAAPAPGQAAAPAVQALATLPNGTRVTIKARNGAWLQVEARHGGRTITGWVEESAVDDVVAHQMQGLMGRQATWQRSGPGAIGTGNDFQRWAEADNEAAFPLTATTRINCWEMILYAAYLTGVINWRWIHELYTEVPLDNWVGRLTRSTAAYVPGTSRLRRGDLVFFDGLAHVAMATGNGDEVYTFWPPPDVAVLPATPTNPNRATLDRVKTSHVSALVSWMTTTFGTAPVVTYGQGSW